MAKVSNKSTLVDRVHIHQIYFKKEQKRFLEKDFIPFDNSNSKRPEWREYPIFLDAYNNKIHEQSELTGFVSWKFAEKAGIGGRQFIQFIEENPGYDVYFINPFPHELVLFKNIWTQGDICHPNFLKIAQSLFDALGYSVNLAEMDIGFYMTAYCNFWVGTPSFWKKYIEFTLPFYGLINTLDDQTQGFLYQKADRVTDSCYIPFFFERLFTTLLVINPAIKAKCFQYPYNLLLKKYGRMMADKIRSLMG